MGAGIAVEFRRRFGLRGRLEAMRVSLTSPTCVLTGIQDVFRDNDVEIKVCVWR
jgi:hypothetical protein